SLVHARLSFQSCASLIAHPPPPTVPPSPALFRSLPFRERHAGRAIARGRPGARQHEVAHAGEASQRGRLSAERHGQPGQLGAQPARKSTRLNSSHASITDAAFPSKKKKNAIEISR